LRKKASAEKAPVWATVAERLSASRKNRPQVNLRKIELHSKDGDVIVVPGKVLGSGRFSKKVEVAAYNFTESARKSIEAAGGKALSILELSKRNAKGSGVRILA